MHHYPIEVVLVHYKKMVAMTTLYGPTEMIDGGFLWVKRCWVLAMARGHYYEEYHGSSHFC